MYMYTYYVYKNTIYIITLKLILIYTKMNITRTLYRYKM